jgi:GNAT superfamily N-acetyltransferase
MTDPDRRTVRLATPSDYTAFARLFPELAIPDPLPTEEQFASDMIPGVVLLCEGEEVLGYSFWQVYGTTAHVVHVVVAPGARGRGAGERLMDAVRARVAAEGCARWYLNVKQDNTRAIRLYQRLGMLDQSKGVSTRVPWASVDALGAADAEGVEVFQPIASDDAAIGARFRIDAARIALLRARPGYVLAALREADARSEGAIAGFAAFDPSFPGAYPFRVARKELARPLLEALRPHARHPDLVVVVEGDPELARALIAAGARVELELVQMGAALAT